MSAKNRYVRITGNDVPPLTCKPEEIGQYIQEFRWEAPDDTVTIETVWLTDEEFAALPEWQP